jgi:hypothetical protein
MQSQAKKTHEAPLFRSATAAVQAIRRRELSSRELTEMLLDACELFVGKIGGIAHHGPERKPSHPSAFIRRFLHARL